MSIKVVKADSTIAAYDDIQMGVIKTGTVIIVESERVIGIAYTWPVAFSKESGHFHPFKNSKLTFDEKLNTMNEWDYHNFDFTESIEQVKIELEKYGF